MSRKDFILIAGVIADLRAIGVDNRLMIAQSFADKLAGTNAAFNRSRFIDACMMPAQDRGDM